MAYSRPGAPEVLILGGPNNPICLSSPQYRHPALFCEVGIETIQTAVPASVRSVRLVLADGRTIQSRVVRVPRRDGGPAGIYAQEIRGSTSHAVSLVELNAGGGVVLTVGLPRYRCVKPRKEPEELPTGAELASGRTPEGEPFTISAFGSLNGEPFLSVDTGVDPELNEPALGLGASKAFPWSLSIGCSSAPLRDPLRNPRATRKVSGGANPPRCRRAERGAGRTARARKAGRSSTACSARCPLN